MAEDSLRSAIDAITSRMHQEVEAQLRVLSSRHLEELEAARRTAEAEAEQRWSARVDEVRAEWTARLESEVAAARGEAERRMVAESMRIRVEAEQAAAEAAARARQELEDALDEERDRAAAELAIQRERLSGDRDDMQRELDTARQQLESIKLEMDALRSARTEAEAALDTERRGRAADARQQEQTAAAAAEARVSERQTQLAVVERVLGAIRSLDAARSLSQVLSALLTAAAAEAPRVALFVMDGSQLKGWKAEGFGADGQSPRIAADEQTLLSHALRRGEPVATSDDAGPAAPAFAQLPPDRAGIAVPLLVGGQPVGVLYADDAGEGPVQVPASWPEAIQILCRHASVNLAHLTAARAAEAMRRSLAPDTASSGRDGASAATAAEDGNSARRYARLLVSEIKLYNEDAVRVGRQKRDLLTRLKPEIERARRMYQQRISTSVDSRGALFQQELVQTLADGDPALLGGSA